MRMNPHPNVKTICDRQDGIELDQALSPEAMAEVKKVVEVYLPGLDDCQYRGHDRAREVRRRTPPLPDG
jgi:hypothetical protein